MKVIRHIVACCIIIAIGMPQLSIETYDMSYAKAGDKLNSRIHPTLTLLEEAGNDEEETEKEIEEKAINDITQRPTQINQRPVNVLLNDKTINYTSDYGKPFIDENNRTQVPLRLTMETFGATVTWDEANDSVLVTKDQTTVEIPFGETYIYVNDKKVNNDTEALIVDNRTYIPIRIVLEAFGAEVLWDQGNYNVVINTQSSTDRLSTLPKKYDIRALNKVTGIRNQGSLGTCWAFATFAALESSLMPEEKWDFSEDHISMHHGFSLKQNEGGDFNMSLAYLTRWAGPVEESKDPYDDGVSPSNLEAVKHVQEAIILPSKNYKEIKKAVYTYGGVQTSVYSPIEDANTNNNYYNKETSALYLYENKTSNHDVVIVGWDDNYPKENFLVEPEGDGAFLCKNSWGTNFGEDGYYYVSYYDKNIGTNNIVYSRVDDKDNYDYIYQTDKLGWLGNLGYDNESAYFSNVYTANSKEKLRAISFYATGDNTSYEIYMVNNFEDTSSFKNMKKLQSGAFAFAGYYTVDLNQAIDLESNQKFAIAVKITTPKVAYPVAIEFDSGSRTSEVDLTDGEGYISLNGVYWENTESKQESNVILKVFTDKY